jgi:hypothetical protein
MAPTTKTEKAQPKQARAAYERYLKAQRAGMFADDVRLILNALPR